MKTKNDFQAQRDVIKSLAEGGPGSTRWGKGGGGTVTRTKAQISKRAKDKMPGTPHTNYFDERKPPDAQDYGTSSPQALRIVRNIERKNHAIWSQGVKAATPANFATQKRLHRRIKRVRRADEKNLSPAKEKILNQLSDRAWQDYRKER